MGFEVIHSPYKPIWVPVDTPAGAATTLYVGQLVVAGVNASCQGVKAWNVAGIYDTTADQIPFGVVIGTNNRTPTFNSTYKTDSITSAYTVAGQLARDWVGTEGMHKKTDPAAMVQVAVLTPETVLKGPIFNGATYGTAITEAVVTAVNATMGLGFTCGTTGFDFTSVAYNATMYCRSGANKGLYRATYSAAAGTAEHLFYTYWPYTIAVGDKFVGANLPVCGTGTINFDDTGQYINGAAAVTTTDYIGINILRLDLERTGAEYAIFTINPHMFLQGATRT